MPAKCENNLKKVLTACGFLAPNIIGVLMFTIFPVVFSLVMAFTNWDLRKHNMFHDEPLDFVGLSNFIRLITEDDFLKYLGNTLFLMMGIPFSVAGALGAAILLSRDTRGGSIRMGLTLLASGALVASILLLTVLGMGATSMLILLTGVLCGVIILGMTGGVTAYRTLFYTPHFVMGVPTFLLWKKMYNPENGPINTALLPVLDRISQTVNTVPAASVQAGLWVCFALMAGLLMLGLSKIRRQWRDGELGSRAVIMPVVFLLIPSIVAMRWNATSSLLFWPALAVMGMALIWQGMKVIRLGRDFGSAPMEGVGGGLVLSLAIMVAQFVLLGLAPVLYNLPDMVAGAGVVDKPGLEPPLWIHDYHWAKPSLMLMGLWGAIGSNNMLLYLAALTNIPQDLYEAADIDGANRFQKFWNVTWPQLAPTTFFIAVMATIHGLQGGFEAARTMTNGGPAGATTTLSYFIYIEGFRTGRLSFSAAVAWALFVMIFMLTLFNWKFGNKYVND